MDYSQLKSAKDHFEAYADLSSGQGYGISSGGKKMMQQHADYMKKNLDTSSQRAAYNKIKSHANALYVNDEISDSDRNFVHKVYAPTMVKEDTDMKLDERKMTEPEMKKREEIAKSMKKGFAGFKKRYGERAKEVMYATATKQAMKEESFDLSDYTEEEILEFMQSEEFEQLDELSKKTLVSYATKAGTALGGHVAAIGASKELSKLSGGRFSSGDLKKVHTDLAKRRMFGIGNAAKRLARESVNEAFKSIPGLALQHHPLQNGKPQLPEKINSKHIHLLHTSGKVNSNNAKYKVIANGKNSMGSDLKVGSHISGRTANDIIDDVHALPRGENQKVIIHTNTPDKYYQGIDESTQDVGQHFCAKHVLSNVFGAGVVLEGQHAEPDENGHVEWYTVEFEHGEEVIFAEDVEIMMAEYHNNHSPAKKAKKAKKVM